MAGGQQGSKSHTNLIQPEALLSVKADKTHKHTLSMTQTRPGCGPDSPMDMESETKVSAGNMSISICKYVILFVKRMTIHPFPLTDTVMLYETIFQCKSLIRMYSIIVLQCILLLCHSKSPLNWRKTCAGLLTAHCCLPCGQAPHATREVPL